MIDTTKNTVKEGPFSIVPTDVKKGIFSNLGSLDSCMCQNVCKSWQSLIKVNEKWAERSDVLVNIFCRIPLSDCFNCEIVCKAWGKTMRNNPIIEWFVPDISRFRFLNNKSQKWISFRNSDEYKLISDVGSRCSSFFSFSSGFEMVETVRMCYNYPYLRHSSYNVFNFSILAGLSSTLSFPASLVNCYIFDLSLITPIALGIGMCSSAVAAKVSSHFLRRIEQPTLMEEREFRFLSSEIQVNQLDSVYSMKIVKRVEELRNGLPPRKAEEDIETQQRRSLYMSGQEKQCIVM